MTTVTRIEKTHVKPKRTYRKKPSAKAKRYAELTVKNLKSKHPKPKGTLMLEAGYSKTTAFYNPQAIEKTKAYQEEFERLMPQKKVIKIHKQLLEAGRLKTMHFDQKIDDKEIKSMIERAGHRFLKIYLGKVPFVKGLVKICYYKEFDNNIIDKAVDKAYKIAGTYAPEKKDIRTMDMNALLDQLNE